MDAGRVLRSERLPIESERLWEVFRQFPGGACVFDEQSRFVACNDGYRSVFAAVADRLVSGVGFEALLRLVVEQGLIEVGDGARDFWIARRLEAHRSGRASMVARLADGREMRIEESRLAWGGSLVTLTDVTLLRQQERSLAARVAELEAMKRQLERQSAELAGLRDEAERANRTKSEFLANMSHELRSPLNAVIGFSEIMKDELFGELGSAQYREYAYDIWQSGRHLLDVINDILDLSKVEAGKLELAESEINLGATIAGCMRLVSARAHQAGITLRSTVGGDDLQIRADERKLKQVLINLLTNSIKFTKSGGRVAVSIGRLPDSRLRIAVADTGIGISPADIPKALSAFGQVDSSLSRRHEGTGLGLPLSKALVELHGGELQIESEPGIGTTVSIVLPASSVCANRASEEAA
jgi:signal transduction histidine kinase